LGIGDPEEMAIVGLLHDIGLADIPQEILQKPEGERTPAEKQTYATHPERSLDMIKRRKIVLSDSALKAIEQQHERFDGTGFPRALPGDRICKEAQLLAFASWFESITADPDPQKRRPPAQAVLELYNHGVTNPSNSPFDPELLKRVLGLFPKTEIKPEVAS
jgi:HD-GYP domain-containing protein (c-di-GMP phosphodiesterase class II)